MTATAISALDAQCDNHVRLRKELARAIRLLVKAQTSHLMARRAGESELSVFEDNLRAAAAAWKLAKESYMDHRKAHGCGGYAFIEEELEN